MPLLHLLRQNPVIAAVKDNASLQLAIDSECQFISVLYGNICTISNIVKKIKNAGKYAFIHVDLLEGALNKEVVIQFFETGNRGGRNYQYQSLNAESSKSGRFFLYSSTVYC
ncbi:glycerol antiterminator regulatory protein [Escherichia coli]|uniref:Glycerol antiterminator regulatory protein n=1 Tax=Escherichia coli TaxID=562 RepID=A0A376D3R1_ECOLX|nr:glycerol antiterminator regulatory protein [Escherichia coli]